MRELERENRELRRNATSATVSLAHHRYPEARHSAEFALAPREQVGMLDSMKQALVTTLVTSLVLGDRGCTSSAPFHYREAYSWRNLSVIRARFTTQLAAHDALGEVESGFKSFAMTLRLINMPSILPLSSW
jgi:hypothetical protein